MARRKTDAEVERENQGAAAAAIPIVMVLVAAFMLSPGMMLVTFCVRPFVQLDRGQMRVFSVGANIPGWFHERRGRRPRW